MSNKHKIEIACDTPEADEFSEYLNKQGHDADIGTSTGNYIDGIWTSGDITANRIMNNLWIDYCNS